MHTAELTRSIVPVWLLVLASPRSNCALYKSHKNIFNVHLLDGVFSCSQLTLPQVISVFHVPFSVPVSLRVIAEPMSTSLYWETAKGCTFWFEVVNTEYSVGFVSCVRQQEAYVAQLEPCICVLCKKSIYYLLGLVIPFSSWGNWDIFLLFCFI